MGEGTVRSRIRRLRFESGEMTQQELAERAGCTRQTIGALEQGGYVPSLAVSNRLVKGLVARTPNAQAIGARCQISAS